MKLWHEHAARLLHTSFGGLIGERALLWFIGHIKTSKFSFEFKIGASWETFKQYWTTVILYMGFSPGPWSVSN